MQDNKRYRALASLAEGMWPPEVVQNMLDFTSTYDNFAPALELMPEWVQLLEKKMGNLDNGTGDFCHALLTGLSALPLPSAQVHLQLLESVVASNTHDDALAKIHQHINQWVSLGCPKAPIGAPL